jgi:hypothetical protein
MNRSALKRAGLLLFLGIGIPLLLSQLFPEDIPTTSLPVLMIVVGLPGLVAYYALDKRSKPTVFNAVFVVVLTVVNGYYAYRPGWVQLVHVPLLLCFLVLLISSCVRIFADWPERRWGGLVPFGTVLLCIPLLVISNVVGRRVRLYVFERRLPEYQEVVEMMGERVKDKPVVEEMPEGYRHLGYYIRAERNEQGVLLVTFFWSSAFPGRHTAFAYVSDGEPPGEGFGIRVNWRYVARINENWFQVGG